MREAEQAGTLPKELEGVDLDTWTPDGISGEFSHGMQVRIEIADFTYSLWFVWVPLVAAVCFGVAFAVGRIVK